MDIVPDFRFHPPRCGSQQSVIIIGERGWHSAALIQVLKKYPNRKAKHFNPIHCSPHYSGTDLPCFLNSFIAASAAILKASWKLGATRSFSSVFTTTPPPGCPVIVRFLAALLIRLTALAIAFPSLPLIDMNKLCRR